MNSDVERRIDQALDEGRKLYQFEFKESAYFPEPAPDILLRDCKKALMRSVKKEASKTYAGEVSLAKRRAIAGCRVEGRIPIDDEDPFLGGTLTIVSVDWP